MCITINPTDSCTGIPDCMIAEGLRIATLDDEHLSILLDLILCSWPLEKAEVQKEFQAHWSFRDEITIIAGITMKGRRIIVSVLL